MPSKKELEKAKGWLLRDKYRNQLPKNNSWESDLKRLVDGEPLDYVIGWREFLGCRIDLGCRPLIPRVETEEWLRDFLSQSKSVFGRVRVLDMFAGSGCLGLAVLKYWPRSQVTFVDKSPEAIKQIRRNLKLNQIDTRRIKIIKSDVWDQVPQDTQFDYILANPPYVPNTRWLKLSSSVRNFEPKMAIVSGKDGLAVIKRFLAGLEKHLLSQTKVILEFDVSQKKWLETALAKKGFKEIEFKRDQFGRWRTVSFRAPF